MNYPVLLPREHGGDKKIFRHVQDGGNARCTSPAAAAETLLQPARVLPPPFSGRCTLQGASRRRDLTAARCTGASPAVSGLLHAALVLPRPGTHHCTLHGRFPRRFQAAARCTGVSPAVFGAWQRTHWGGPLKTTLLTLFHRFGKTAVIRSHTVRVLCSAGADQPPNRNLALLFPPTCRGPFRTSLFR